MTWLNLDLAFQNYSSEFATLPGPYAPPTGCLLLARSASTDTVLGCVALRPLASVSPQCCEMKRLFVLPAGRGMGVGKALVTAVVKEAKRLGYTVVKLDTLPRMTAAIDMYARLGFERCDRYYDTPLVGTVFMEMDLGGER